MTTTCKKCGEWIDVDGKSCSCKNTVEKKHNPMNIEQTEEDENHL